ncbi:MAG: YceI family protein, partial [Bacteroidota bacterium]
MKKLLLPTLLLISSFLTLFASNWTVTDGYAIKFSTAKAEGTFSDLQGTIEFDPEALDKASFDVSVATATINTGNKKKDKHARGGKW